MLSGRWLNENERRYLVLQNVIKNAGRGTSDDGEKADKFKWSYLKDLLTDYKVYLQAWILFTASVCAYGLKFTMPSITKSMGYTSSQAQLMTIPPYVAGAISAIALSKLSDKFQWRAPFIFGQMAVVTLGFAILLALAPNIKHQIPACYIGVVLVCIGQYPTNPAGSAWISSNLAGESKRAMGIALNIALGNCGGIVGSYIVSLFVLDHRSSAKITNAATVPRQREARIPYRLRHWSWICCLHSPQHSSPRAIVHAS